MFNPEGPDIQAAVSVVGRRSQKHDIRPIDLTGADLTGADLTGADLTGANLGDARLGDAYLTGAYLPTDTVVPTGWKRDASSGRLVSTRTDTSATKKDPPGARTVRA